MAEIAQATEIRGDVNLTVDKWKKFLAKTKKEPITRAHGRTASFCHLRKLAKNLKFCPISRTDPYPIHKGQKFFLRSNLKNLYIIAGPNGSGKTTFAKKFLPLYAHCEHFINADLIAQGLSPFSPSIAAMKAGRIVLKEIQELADKGATFAFETIFLALYRHLLDSWYLFDNSTAEHCLVAKEKDGKLFVTDTELFAKISR